MIEGSKNLKGNDKGKNKHETPQSAKDAKKLDNKGADWRKKKDIKMHMI